MAHLCAEASSAGCWLAGPAATPAARPRHGCRRSRADGACCRRSGTECCAPARALSGCSTAPRAAGTTPVELFSHTPLSQHTGTRRAWSGAHTHTPHRHTTPEKRTATLVLQPALERTRTPLDSSCSYPSEYAAQHRPPALRLASFHRAGPMPFSLASSAATGSAASSRCLGSV